MTPEEAVNATFDEAKAHLPTIDLADALERCRALALWALKHECSRMQALRIWEGKK